MCRGKLRALIHESNERTSVYRTVVNTKENALKSDLLVNLGFKMNLKLKPCRLPTYEYEYIPQKPSITTSRIGGYVFIRVYSTRIYKTYKLY